MLQTASYPPLHTTQGRGTHSLRAVRKIKDGSPGHPSQALDLADKTTKVERPVRPSFEGRDLSTAHAGSLRSPACFAQDDNGGRCGVMGARSESFLLSPSTSLWAGSPGLGSFYLTYSGLTSWANVCRRFAAGGRVGRQPPWASAKSGAKFEVKIPNLSRHGAAR